MTLIADATFAANHQERVAGSYGRTSCSRHDQWGYRYRMRQHTGAEPIRSGGKLIRILQRQPDGSWKIFRGISTVDTGTLRSGQPESDPGGTVGDKM